MHIKTKKKIKKIVNDRVKTYILYIITNSICFFLPLFKLLTLFQIYSLNGFKWCQIPIFPNKHTYSGVPNSGGGGFGGLNSRGIQNCQNLIVWGSTFSKKISIPPPHIVTFLMVELSKNLVWEGK